MIENLVIVESTSKIKSFQKILGDRYTIIATGGHLCNLPTKELGIDIHNHFSASYVPLEGKKAKIKELTTKLKAAKNIWLATDKDFEGERISEDIRKLGRLQDFNRVYFTEITPDALGVAFSNPRKHLDEGFLDCQETRRIMDRLVGYKLSPVLWKHFTDSFSMHLSVGRVQSATLSLIVDRAIACEHFRYEKKWKMKARFDGLGDQDCIFYENYAIKIWEKKEIAPFFQGLFDKFTMHCEDTEKKKVLPSKPFITSSLQQVAYQQLGFPIGKTMKIAQGLYEKGCITYLRTDSYHLSEQFVHQARSYLLETYGEQYVNPSSYQQVVNRKNAQGAHEAIRPTDATQKNARGFSDDDYQKLYQLIWIRTLSSLLRPMIYEEMPIRIKDLTFTENQYFQGVVKTILSEGFTVLSGGRCGGTEGLLIRDRWDDRATGCQWIEAYESSTAPPPHYDEASLVKKMETEGIGRPSTYQMSIEKLMTHGYIKKSSIKGREIEISRFRWKRRQISTESQNIIIGGQNNRIVLTQIGQKVFEFLKHHFPFICNTEFTKNMETNIDKILSQSIKKIQILTEFYGILEPFLSQPIAKTTINESITSIKIKNKVYRIKRGKFGYFLQYTKDKKSANIPLEPYLKNSGKTVEMLGEIDIQFLTSLPMVFMKNNCPITIEYGRYGFYSRDSKLDHTDVTAILSSTSFNQ